MTEGPIARQLLCFTLPILLSQLLQQFYNIADTAIIGQYIGADALAATGTAGLLLSVIVNFFIGLSAGISVIISHLFGHREYQKLSSCIQTIIIASTLLGFLFTFVGLWGTPLFLKWLDTPAEIIPLAVCYLNICFWGMAGVALATFISQWLSAFLVLWKLFHMEGEFFRVFWCNIWEFCIHDMRIVYTSYDVSWIVMLVLLAGGYRYYSAKYTQQLQSEPCFS